MTHDPSYRRILHRMGYYDYQQGLIYRHLRQDEGWISHEQRCRQFIMKAIDLLKPGKVTVIGSGWLLDLPLAEMAEKVKMITLSDIVHPPDVLEQASGFKHVMIQETDVTGGLVREVWEKAGKRYFLSKLKSLEDIHIPGYIPAEDPGLVISLNILTQLEVLPERLLRKKSAAPEDEFLKFKKEVQAKHLEFLQKYRSVLISDISEIVLTPDGTATEKETLLAALPQGDIKEDWIWDFDLAGNDSARKKSKFKIIAMIL